jgi:hypothetical protein
MAARLIRLTHRIAIRLHLGAEGCTICSSLSRRPVRKLLHTPVYAEDAFGLHRSKVKQAGKVKGKVVPVLK